MTNPDTPAPVAESNMQNLHNAPVAVVSDEAVKTAAVILQADLTESCWNTNEEIREALTSALNLRSADEVREEERERCAKAYRNYAHALSQTAWAGLTVPDVGKLLLDIEPDTWGDQYSEFAAVIRAGGKQS